MFRSRWVPQGGGTHDPSLLASSSSSSSSSHPSWCAPKPRVIHRGLKGNRQPRQAPARDGSSPAPQGGGGDLPNEWLP